MGASKRSVRIGVAVGVGSTLFTGTVVSIADDGTAGVAAVDHERPTFDTTASPSVTPAIETAPADVPPDAAVLETSARQIVVAPVLDGPAAAADVPAGGFDRVVLVGDSLADEASPIIRYLTPHTEMVPRYFGGTAPCDWLDRDLDATATTVVVISFTGNNHRDCMLDAAGVPMVDDALVEKYDADVRVLIERATTAGAWVLLVGQPRHHPVLDADVEIDGLNAVYQHLADTLPRVSFVDAGQHVESPDGHYTDRLPCTDHDIDCAADGTTIVRGDGVHFCPVVDVNPCPVWSSGAVRFGGAIAAAINAPTTLDAT